MVLGLGLLGLGRDSAFSVLSTEWHESGGVSTLFGADTNSTADMASSTPAMMKLLSG